MAPIPVTLCELFATAVERTPDNLAVDHEDACVSYRELDEASSTLADNLSDLGVRKGSAVLLLTAHGTFNIIATLAILKTGACFVPMDRRTWSPDTIKYVCDTVDSPVIINTTSEPFICHNKIRKVVQITEFLKGPLQKSPCLSISQIEPEDTACIIFTSGSTGQPKGVMISHRSLCLYSQTRPVNLNIRPGDRLLHMLSVAFDASACMLFSTLGNGGTVVPANAEDVLLKAPSCTVMGATPSLLKNLPAPNSESCTCYTMRRIILGGETATTELLESWIDAGVQVLTAYGVTETTSMGTIYDVRRDPHTGEINPFLIGGYMKESPIWIVDDQFSLIGDDSVEGEIVVGGDGVAQGYYKDEQKTERAFKYWNGFRVFKTGDYGRWIRSTTGDRVIEFRGRRDRTVKNRGFLVNIGYDVEDTLCRVGKSLGVQSVLAEVTKNGIIAVVTPLSVDTTALLEIAKQSMCSYCIPYQIEAIEDIPLSANGKVQNRKVLDIITAINNSKHLHQMEVVKSEIRHTTNMGIRLEKVLRLVEEIFGQPGERLGKIQSDDNFIKMGGSSLLAYRLVSVLRQNNLHISVRDLLRCQTFSEVAEKTAEKSQPYEVTALGIIKDATVAEKLLDLRKQACDTLGLPENSFDIGPLTNLQLELAVPTLSDESRSVNQVKLAYSGIYADMVERAWRSIWQIEPVFRTEISLVIGCGAQIIRKSPFRKPLLMIYSSRTEYDAAVKGVSMDVGLGCKLEFFAFHQSVDASIRRNTTGSLIEVDELTVVLTIHHSLMDGLSLKMLSDKVERASHGWPLPSSTSSIEANFELIDLQHKRDIEARNFFSSYLRNVPLGNTATYQHEVVSTKKRHNGIEKSLTTVLFSSSASMENVQAFAIRSCVSTASVFYTAWAMAISAMENSSAVIVGAVFSNRMSLRDHENAIGAYMSTLPLKFNFDADEIVPALLQRTMDELVTLGEYSWARSDQVGIGQRLWNLLAMQVPLPDENSKPPALRAESLENCDFPLSLLVESNGNLRVIYDTTQFDDKIIQRLGEHFKHALSSLLIEARVGDCMRINQLQETMLKQMRHVGSETGNLTVKRALERSIDRFPAQIALEDNTGRGITYGELDRLTNIIAHQINTSLSDTRSVALYCDGSINWILGLLGILKTGRSYVPIDPKWSFEHRASVCNKSGSAALLLPAPTEMYEMQEIRGFRVFVLANMLKEAPGHSAVTTRLPDIASPDSDLVIVFTSGTTGEPKGVPITNRGYLALQSNPEAIMFASPGRRIAQFMSPAFDYCNLEIFSALLTGATLVLRDPVNPFVHLTKVDTTCITPSVLAVLDLNEFPNLKMIYAAGEPITPALVEKFGRRTLLYNAYGPAECTVCTSITRMIPGDTVTIGTAISTARMYVLDEERRHAPDTVRGEIYVAGVQVMQEYLKSPEQTARRIFPDPWHINERMYRTGDYGSRGFDGRITYMGRTDRQVKIRGFRVELAGVEQAILSGPTIEGVVQCAVLAINGMLIAYIVFSSHRNDQDSEAQRIARLRQRLDEQLFPSWVPQVIRSLRSFPKSVNGKIDTKALEVMCASSVSVRGTTMPDSPSHDIESQLAEAWRQILQLEPTALLQDSDDFLKLGGHSVLVMLLATRLTTAFRVKITVRDLLSALSFRSQINVIQSLLQSEDNEGKREAVTETQSHNNEQRGKTLTIESLTALERQVWFQYQVATTVSGFNIAKILHLGGTVDIVRLVEAFNAALAADPVLRSRFVEGPDGPRRILSDHAPKIRQAAYVDINMEVNHCFDLANEDLIRVHLLRCTAEGRARKDPVAQLVIVTSHIIADLGTLQNILRLTSSAYSGDRIIAHERPLHLDSDQWRKHASLVEQSFWKKYLSGHAYADERPALLRRFLFPLPLATFQGVSRTREFRGKQVTTLNNLLRTKAVTHHQMGLSVAALLLQWLTGENDIVLGSPNANRSTAADQEALGQFLERLPIRVNLNESITTQSTKISATLVQVRNSALEALANAISFSDLLETLGFPNGELHHPIFECMVTFHPRSAALENCLHLNGCNVSASSHFSHGAKFPLMLEWFELDSDRWSLHIESDTSYLPPTTIDMIGDALEVILIAMGDECSLSELQSRLAVLDLSGLNPHKVVQPSVTTISSLRCSKAFGYLRSAEEVVTLIQAEMAACLGISSDVMSPGGSFFLAGADSAAVITLRHRLRKLGLKVPVRAVFMAQSPIKLAEHVILSDDNQSYI